MTDRDDHPVMERSLVAEQLCNQRLTDEVDSDGSIPSVPNLANSIHIPQRASGSSQVSFCVIFLQRARHQHIYTLRMDSLYVSVSTPPFGVAAIGCHYGAGRTVAMIRKKVSPND